MHKYSPISILLLGTFFLFPIAKIKAQIRSDNTLGKESSIVTPLDKIGDQIDGGAIRGTNLFHSFQEFNIQKSRAVYFTNPLGIENILTRVTGNNISHILGTLGVKGTANLFLINPNGIHFGKNASLDIKGSFTTTTADSIKLGEDGLFSATNPRKSKLLTIQPSALFTNTIRKHQATINNQGNLSVNPEKSILVSGDRVINNGSLTAPRGQIFIFGNNINLFYPSKIDVSSPIGGGTILIGGGLQGRNNFPTAKNTYVGSGVTIKADALSRGNGGNIIIWSDKNTNFHGNISAQGGLKFGNGGFVEVSAKEKLIFRGNVNTNAVNGLAGNLLIDPTNIIIANGSGAINDLEIDDGEILGTTVADTFTISEQKLEQISGDTNISLQATNDIILQNLDDNFLDFSPGKGIIEFIADSDNNRIGNFIMEDSQDSIRTNGRNIQISGANLHLGSINTTFLGGTVTTNINIDAGGTILDAEGTLDNPIPISNDFNFTVTNLATISDIDVIFSATHSFVSDLDVSLTSPQGTTVNLFAFIGGDGVNFQDTRLNNQATTSINNFSVSAPFAGEFIPEGNLDQFNGENPNGKWTLTVRDNFPDFAGTLFQPGDSNIPWSNPIGTQLILTSGLTNGDSGSIQLNATNGNINARGLDTSSSSGITGNILLNATGKIAITEQIKTLHNHGNGGNVTLKANNNITLNNLLDTSALGDSLGIGGTVFIESKNGSLTTNSIHTTGRIQGGNITLAANEKINLENSIQTTGINDISGDINIAANGDILMQPGIDIAAFSVNGLGGNIHLKSQGNIIMNDGAISNDSFNQTNLDQQSGNININSNTFIAKNTAQIRTSTFGIANAGDIKITAENILIDDSLISARVAQQAIGNGGNIELIADSISISKNSQIFSSSQGEGNAGNIAIKTSELQITNLSEVSVFSQSTFSGHISLENLDNLKIVDSQIRSNTANGTAGKITINTSELTITDQGMIIANNSNGIAGNVNITADKFTANNGAQILTTTSGNNQAGNISLEVREKITLEGYKTGLFANTEPGSKGDSGNINFHANITPKTFIISNGAGVAVNTKGTGEGGNIYLQAGTLILDNQAFITAETTSNQGGEINLNLQDLFLLRNNSQITATAGTDGTGGNGGDININTPFIVAFPQENSDITANASLGNGGEININTNAIFGLEFRPQLTTRSDITASSQFGLAGEVEINTPDVDPTSGLIELPGNLIESANQLSQGCKTDTQINTQGNTFMIVGRGGLPSDPSDLFTGTTPLLDLLNLVDGKQTNKQKVTSVAVNNQSINSQHPVIEAQGWIITSDGRVILTATAPKVNPPSSQLNHPGCSVY